MKIETIVIKTAEFKDYLLKRHRITPSITPQTRPNNVVSREEALKRLREINPSLASISALYDQQPSTPEKKSA